MVRAILLLSSLGLALFVLAFSLYRISSPQYKFYQPSTSTPEDKFMANVDYSVPKLSIRPDNPLWISKAGMDKVQYLFTTDSLKRSILLLQFADQRLGSAEILIVQGDVELGVATAKKAEQYLFDSLLEGEKAGREGVDVSSHFQQLAKASLYHREVLEQVLDASPDDAKPVLSEIISTPKEVYEKSVQQLQHNGQTFPTPRPTAEKL